VTLAIENVPPPQIPMDNPFTVNADQPLSDTCQLAVFSYRSEVVSEEPTSPSRSTSGFALTKSLMFPFAIQSDIIANRVSDIVAPTSGRAFGAFGCRRNFHVTTSLQNLYTGHC